MKKVLSFILSLALAVVSFGAIACATPPPPPVSVTATFTVAQLPDGGSPVYEENAVITFSNGSDEYSGTVGADGTFTLTLNAGTYSLSYENLTYNYGLKDSSLQIVEGTTEYTLEVIQTGFDLFPNADGNLVSYNVDTDTYNTEFVVPAGVKYSYSSPRVGGKNCRLTTTGDCVLYVGANSYTPTSGQIEFVFSGDVSDTFALQTVEVLNNGDEPITITFTLYTVEESVE